MNKKKYLIFGNGFIGGHYASHLLLKNSDVKVIYRSKPNDSLPLKIQKKSDNSIDEIVKILLNFKPDYVLLTQGISFIPNNEKDLENSISSNLIAPLKVIEAIHLLRKNKKSFTMPQKIVTFGSAAEYGNSNKKIFTESTPLNPTSLYGLNKKWLYQASHYYFKLGIPCVHIRQFNAVGAGQHPGFAISSFCRQLALMEKGKQKPVLKVGDLTQKRDFIDIRDSLSAFDIILDKAKDTQVINVCSGKSYSLEEIVKKQLRKLTAVDFSVNIEKKLIAETRSPNNIVAGNPILLKKLGWKAKYTLSESLKWTLDYWRNQTD